MYKFLFLLITSFCFGQSFDCLERRHVADLISQKIESKSLECKQLNYGKIKFYNINNKVKIYLSNTSSSIEITGKNKEISFSQLSKDKKNIFLNLEEAFCLKYKKEIFYILEFKTLHQGISENTYNIIVSENKKTILFQQWNSSGDGISNAVGISNHNLFVLNQIRDSINFYELQKDKFIYKLKNSSSIKIDSLGQICVQQDYEF